MPGDTGLFHFLPLSSRQGHQSPNIQINPMIFVRHACGEHCRAENTVGGPVVFGGHKRLIGVVVSRLEPEGVEFLGELLFMEL
jgi:hypothetical protein